jgi:hypothetical protein
MNNECDHTETVRGSWYSDLHDTTDSGFWTDDYKKPTTVDVDLHRYKCIQCGKLFSY